MGGIDRTRYRNMPPLWFGYSADTLLDEFTMPSPVFRAGKFMSVPPLDPGERVAVDFPKFFRSGTIPVDTTIHSEVATLPLSFGERGIREVTFRQGFDTEFRDRLSLLVQLGLAETTALASSRSQGSNGSGIVPRDLLLALVGRFPPPVPIGKPHRYEVLRTVVGGTHRGRRVTVTADCHAGSNAGWG